MSVNACARPAQEAVSVDAHRFDKRNPLGGEAP